MGRKYIMVGYRILYNQKNSLLDWDVFGAYYGKVFILF